MSLDFLRSQFLSSFMPITHTQVASFEGVFSFIEEKNIAWYTMHAEGLFFIKGGFEEVKPIPIYKNLLLFVINSLLSSIKSLCTQCGPLIC